MGVYLSMKQKRIMYTMLFLFVVVLLLAACGGNSSAPATSDSDENGQAEEQTSSNGTPITMKISHFLPAMHSQQTLVLEPLMEELEALSNGRIQAEFYPANALGTPDAHYDLVETGIADLGLSILEYSPGRFPLSTVSELPFMVDSAQSGADLIWQLYEEVPEIQAEFKDTKILWLFTNDPDLIFTKDKEITSIDDLRGLRIRSPGPFTNKLIESWGAVPVAMPMNDSYDALQRGVVDGLMAPFSAIINFNLAEVTDYILEDPFYAVNFFVTMNLDTWNSLTPEEQSDIEAVLDKYRNLAAQTYDDAAAAGRKAAEEMGVTVGKLSDQELQNFKTSMEPLYQEWIENMNGRGLPGQTTFEKAKEISGLK